MICVFHHVMLFLHLIMPFSLFSLAPTVPPTLPVPPTTPSDECDDEQANCHSGTGDDYEQTGANSRACALPYYTLHANYTP